MRPCIDGKIRAQMWSITRASLLCLLLIGCKKEEVLPAACPEGTAELEGVCRSRCASHDECLLSEFCDPMNQACMPEPITDCGAPPQRSSLLRLHSVIDQRNRRSKFGSESSTQTSLGTSWPSGSRRR